MPAYKYSTKKGTMWLAKINYIDPQTQKPCQKIKRGFKTQKEAKMYEASFFTNLEKEVQKGILGPESLFTEVYEAYMRHVHNKKGKLATDTIETKTNMITHHILPFFRNYKIGKITEDVLIKWQEIMREKRTKDGNPYSDTYLHSIQSQLNAILNYAVHKKIIYESPMAELENLGKKHADEMDIWTPEEHQCFSLAAMDDPETYYLFELYYWCGLRRGEGLALTYGDICIDDDGVMRLSITKSINARRQVGNPKTDSSKRSIVVPESLADELIEYIDSQYKPQPTDFLFPISTHQLYRAFDRACKAAGVKRIRIHDLRHSFASVLIDSKRYSPVDVAQQLGHASANSTMRTYAHLLEPTKYDVAKTLDNIRKGVENVSKESG